MKFAVYFKDLCLGAFSQQDGKIVYNSNLEDEQVFEQSYISSDFYSLFKSENAEIKTWPSFLEKFLESTQNQYLIEKAKIQPNDDEFTKLYKLSCLDFDDMGFYIKAI